MFHHSVLMKKRTTPFNISRLVTAWAVTVNVAVFVKVNT